MGPLKDCEQSIVTAGDEAMSEVLNYFSIVFSDEGDGTVPEEDGIHCNAQLNNVTYTSKKVQD